MCLLKLFVVAAIISTGSPQSHTIPKSVVKLPRFARTTQSSLQLMQLMRDVSKGMTTLTKYLQKFLVDVLSDAGWEGR